MNITKDDPRLTAYALGELEGQQRQDVEREVAASAELQREVEGIRRTAEMLEGALAAEPLPTGEEVAPAAASQPIHFAPRKMRSPRAARWLWFAGSLAAACVIGAIVIPMSFSTARNSVKQNEIEVAVAPSSVEYRGKKAKLEAERDSSPPAGSASRTKSQEHVVGLTPREAPAAARAGKGTAAAHDASGAAGPSSGSKIAGAFALTSLAEKEQPHGEAAMKGFSDGEFNTEAYDHGEDGAFLRAAANPLSTFSIDVDTASYSNVRRMLTRGQRPPKGAVRIEEMVNYFPYTYPSPAEGEAFSINIDAASCPWASGHRLVRIGLKGREIASEKRPPLNLVFLLDVSGSMNQANKLPLVKSSMKMLVGQLTENDRVAIVVYAGSSGLVLPSITGDRHEKINEALDNLSAGGSTNGGQGIRLAYKVAVDNLIRGGANRVVLCTDGDFNVGTTNQSELVELVEKNAKTGVFLSVLGFGMGNLKDSTLEKLADKGNGNYAYIDDAAEARKALVEQLAGTLITIAKDVKIQVEFNPAKVQAYRLIGYENRMLRSEDFNDDKKDAGEIGAGHTVTAMYEIVLPGEKLDLPEVDVLKYQQPATDMGVPAAKTDELLTVKVRYKQPDGDKSTLLSRGVRDEGKTMSQASEDFRFAASVAAFGMVLCDSRYKGSYTLDAVAESASSSCGADKGGYRKEFVELIAKAKKIIAGTTSGE